MKGIVVLLPVLPIGLVRSETVAGAMTSVRAANRHNASGDGVPRRAILRRWLAGFVAVAALLASWGSCAQTCQIKSGSNGVRCLSPGSACKEGGLHGTCRQLSDECECFFRPPPPQNYRIGGTVTGLSAGNTVIILDNSNSVLTAANGPFNFTTIATGYSISVNQPSGQQCTVANGHGSAPAAGVSNIVVTCTTPADITPCDSKGCVSEAQICANISNSLENPPPIAGVTPPAVVGYVCIAGALPPVYGGLARTTSNPPQTPMSPSLTTNIASVSKTMTAIAVLQLLEKNGLSIDTLISPYVYKDWSQGANINQISFKELLNHTSGFGQVSGCDGSLLYSDVQAIVAGGVNSGDIGNAKYGNCNFTLLRELMPALLGQSLVCPFAILGLTNICFPYGAQRAEMSSALYINYLNANVFQPTGVPLSACKPPAGTNDILSYPDPAGTSSGTDFGDWSLTCGAGGWSLSASQIFSVINSLANNNVLLTDAEKNQMFTDCLGWDCTVRQDCPFPSYVCKNGFLPGPNNTTPWSASNIAVWTYAGILNCAIPVVVVVNSNTPPPYQALATKPESADIIDLVADAYAHASLPGKTQTCPWPDP